MNRPSGQSTVELIAGVIVIIPIILCLVDLSIIAQSSFKNDSICREACRAAAAGDPKDCQKNAEQEISKYNTAGGFTRFSLAGSPTTQNLELPASGHGLVRGTVSVKTSASVHAPFIIGFFSPNFTLQTEQSFPFTYTMP